MTYYCVKSAVKLQPTSLLTYDNLEYVLLHLNFLLSF